ncbi:MAG TPA: HNH endonuclease [Gemmataceae bacterium]|nr:HNH endonuclease [Gemmataceae bacterium]
MDDSVEEWKPVVGFESAYQVSNKGRVYSRYRHRQMKGHVNWKGYAMVGLQKDGWGRKGFIHGMVAEAFLGPKPSGLVVNHIDGNKLNNWVGNLEYVTIAENNRHALATGLRKPRRGGVKLNEEMVREIRMLTEFMGCKKLAKQFGVCHQTIRRIVRREEWGHVE